MGSRRRSVTPDRRAPTGISCRAAANDPGWSHDPDRWLRRTSITCQLDAKERTDLSLLSTTILANADDPDFFLRKGIGWALRQYARVDPDWVRTFVADHDLSPLSRREAMKHLAG